MASPPSTFRTPRPSAAMSRRACASTASRRARRSRLRLLASDIDGGAFGAAAGIDPAGAGRPRNDLGHPEGPGRDLGHVARSMPTARSRRASGRVPCRASMWTASCAMLGEGRPFPLDDVSQGSFADRRPWRSRPALPTAWPRIETAEAGSASRQIASVGHDSLQRRQTGTLRQSRPATPAVDGQGDEAPFVVGGSWSAPFISAGDRHRRRIGESRSAS